MPREYNSLTKRKNFIGWNFPESLRKDQNDSLTCTTQQSRRKRIKI